MFERSAESGLSMELRSWIVTTSHSGPSMQALICLETSHAVLRGTQ